MCEGNRHKMSSVKLFPSKELQPLQRSCAKDRVRVTALFKVVCLSSTCFATLSTAIMSKCQIVRSVVLYENYVFLLPKYYVLTLSGNSIPTMPSKSASV